MTTSRIHDVLPRIAVWLAPVFLAILVLSIWAILKLFRLPADVDVFEVVAGQWGDIRGDNSCDKNPHTIAFSADRATMTYTDNDGTWEYDVLEHETGRIRGVIRGEKRLTDAGDPVVWDLLLRGPNMYAWHRTDWPAMQTTDLVLRCGKPWGLPTDSAAS